MSWQKPLAGSDPSLLEPRISSVESMIAGMKQESDITVTVGSTGDFSTINAALEYLSKRRLKYSVLWVKAEIKLLAGFVMAEQVYVEGINLGWITITSEASVVTINRAALTRNLVDLPSYDGGATLPITSYGAFVGLNNAVLPAIKVLFNMDATGTSASRDAFFVGNGSQLVIHKDCGCTNAGGKGLNATQGSNVVALGANLSYAIGTGISCFRGSRVVFRGGNASYSTSHAIYVDSASIVEAQSANLSNAGGIGLYVDGASTVACPYANISNAGSDGIRALNGSSIDADFATINNAISRGVSSDGSLVSAKNASILNAGADGINCTGAGTVNADTAVVTGAVAKGLYATFGGKINARGVNARKIDVDGTDDIRVAYGGIISAVNAIGGNAGTINTISASGIIWRN